MRPTQAERWSADSCTGYMPNACCAGASAADVSTQNPLARSLLNAPIAAWRASSGKPTPMREPLEVLSNADRTHLNSKHPEWQEL